MNKNIMFWVIIVIIVVVIAVLLQFAPKSDGSALIVETVGGEIIEVPFNDILKLEGITFPTPDLVINQFYEKYKKDNLIKVFFVQQLLPSGDFTRFVFHSVDGARVMIEDESLVLIALEKQNEDYTLRLIIPEDNFSQRWLKNVCRITIEA